MLQFDLPIMYRATYYWYSGRMPIIDCTKPKVLTVMRRLQFCIEGVGTLFSVPDDAFMLQFVVSSKQVPNSYQCRIEDDGTVNVGNRLYYDWVTVEIAKAILNHSGENHVWYLQCFYWVVE